MISVITVHLNDWDRLMNTAASVARQRVGLGEWIVKDGASRPQGVTKKHSLPPHRWISMPDNGLYDAMNQSMAHATGDLVQFLNCGDELWSDDTLEKVWSAWQDSNRPDIIYGNVFDESEGAVITYPRKLGEFYVFRRTVCQQAIFYRRGFLKEMGYFDTQYRVCADNDFLVRAVTGGKASFSKIDATLVRYGAGGISSTHDGIGRGLLEVRKIRQQHFSIIKQLLWSSLITSTLPGLRSGLIRRYRGSRLALTYRRIANILNG